MREPEVVIAGCGAISAVGCGIEPLRAALQNNLSGLRPSEKFNSPRFQSNIVGAVPVEWWGEASDEPALVLQSAATTAREDARPTKTDNPVWNLATEALEQTRESSQNILAEIP